MRNIPLASVDNADVDVLPIATDYPSGHLLDWHEHRRAQLLYAATGTMLVETADGAWTVPGERAVLIPPRTQHRVRMLDVQTNSLYVEPAAVPWWPERCEVVEVSPLLRELLLAAADLGAADAADAADPVPVAYLAPDRSAPDRSAPDDLTPAVRAGALLGLLLIELARARTAPLHLPLPETPQLAGLCRAYLADPDVGVSNSDWAHAAVLSERALTREFRRATGMSPAAWRARARLLAAVPILRHRNVTEVAMLLGYASPDAFSYAFAKELGSPPSAFRARGVDRASGGGSASATP